MTTDQTPVRLADGSTPKTPEELFTWLDQLGVRHTTAAHPPMYTVEQSKKLRGSPQPHGGYTKNLFLRNKKGSMWLITCSEDRLLDLRSLAIGLETNHLSFGSPQRLMKYLGVSPGAVSPLALINDTSQSVCFVIEKQLLQHRIIHLHPLDNCRTITIETHDLLRFTQSILHLPLGLTFQGSEAVITRKVGLPLQSSTAKI